jgi:hypothetical protein
MYEVQFEPFGPFGAQLSIFPGDNCRCLQAPVLPVCGSYVLLQAPLSFFPCVNPCFELKSSSAMRFAMVSKSSSMFQTISMMHVHFVAGPPQRRDG